MPDKKYKARSAGISSYVHTLCLELGCLSRISVSSDFSSIGSPKTLSIYIVAKIGANRFVWYLIDQGKATLPIDG